MEINWIYDFYSSSKINTFQGQRNKATAIIKCRRGNFINLPVHYFCLMSKKMLEESKTTKNVVAAENKLQKQEKKSALQRP